MSKTIELTQGKVAIVDDEDFERVAQYKWHTIHAYNHLWYGCHSFGKYPRQKMVYLHRFILKPHRGMTVDHINGNGLDNRRANLRVCTLQENLKNRHGYRRPNSAGVPSHLLKRKDAAALKKVCPATIFNYVQRGLLNIYHVPGEVAFFVDRTELDRLFH